MGVAGSVGINIGQNLQASGLQALPEAQRNQPHRSKLWRFGLTMFILFSLANFAALALAPASVLTPLESIQFVTNIAWNTIVNKKAASRRMLTGVALSLMGTVLTVVFGAQPSGCHSLAELKSFWASGAWWTYLAATLTLAAAALAYHSALRRRQLERPDHLPPHATLLLPVAYTLSSALVGGAQMIVHSKVVSEVLAMLLQGDASVFASWLLYVELLLVTCCGTVWAWRLTACLVLYDPLTILPLMVGTYILFGGIAGGIYFGEFRELHKGIAGWGSWPLYLGGMALVLCGLYLIADAGAQPAAVQPVRQIPGEPSVASKCAFSPHGGTGGGKGAPRGKGSWDAFAIAVAPGAAAVKAKPVPEGADTEPKHVESTCYRGHGAKRYASYPADLGRGG